MVDEVAPNPSGAVYLAQIPGAPTEKEEARALKGGSDGFIAHRGRGRSPPLGVFLQVGIGKHFWINILLTILGYIPGIIHAVWVIAKY